MPTYRVILAVVLSSFLALSTVSCNREEQPGKTGEKKVDQTTPQPEKQPPPAQAPGGTQQPGGVEPGQTTGEKPAGPGGTGQPAQ